MKNMLITQVILMILALSCNGPSDISPIRVVTELDIGESQVLTLTNGSKVELRLLEIEVVRDSLRNAIRNVKVTVNVNGEEVILGSGNYHLPVEVGGVQIDCPVVKNYYTNSNADRWGLSKDARFRLWPKGSSYMNPGTFIYPVKQRWCASMSQSGNEPPYVDWGENLDNKNIYYHFLMIE